MDKLDAFTAAYIEAALWSSNDEAGNPLDSGDAELSPELRNQMIDDCTQFQAENSALLLEAYATADNDENITYGEDRAGHDFWLTRCHHGAGFWDRGLGEIGDKLTEAAHVCGDVDLYIGDDGLIYGM